MSDLNCKRVQLGDWVKGISKNEYAYQGYVEAISESQQSALIRVVACHHNNSVGKVLESSLDRLVPCEFEVYQDEQDVYALIDMALSTYDREWFLELTEVLSQFRQNTVLHTPDITTIHSMKFPRFFK